MRLESHRRPMGAVILLLALLLGLAGCGASNPPPQTLSARTSSGLSYTLLVTVDGKQQCATTTYRALLPGRRPVLQGSHLCGTPTLPGHPVLIQAEGSLLSLVTDVSVTSCGPILASGGVSAPRPLVTRCSPGHPHFRVTILPAARRLRVVGIPGAPVINFPRHPCRQGLCVTPLA